MILIFTQFFSLIRLGGHSKISPVWGGGNSSHADLIIHRNKNHERVISENIREHKAVS